MSERAKAAYAAYGEVVGWKNFKGDPMPQFSELPEAIQQAWDAACEGALRHWLNNEFDTAIQDDKRVEVEALRMVKVGQERGDDPHTIMRVAIASFVVGIIEPKTLWSGQHYTPE